jgi:putative ABC transport system permease protein
VIGAEHHQLVIQHLAESVLVTAIAATLAVVAVMVVLPFLNNIYQRFADMFALLEPMALLSIAGLVLVVGLLAGLYPALILSSFKPIVVLKGAFKNSKGGVQLRKALVVLQFTISIALMVGTGIVYQQMRYIYTADLGFNREQVVTIQQNGEAVNRSVTLRNELQKNSAVLSTGTSTVRLGQISLQV